ncbi:bifunctional riboflavin kinase/FMN adenylyltransferase, partial [Buchnera aphidicola]|nr:bifunctional riboflavin kinase/FMN adenylyltransferase [Buchnera aphidicola]
VEFFKNNNHFKRLMNLQTKIKCLSHFHINYILCIKFNQNFSNLSPEDFITNILINKLHAKFIVVGDDFKFGAGKRGNINTLEKM